MTRQRSLNRMTQRVDRLINSFPKYVARFERSDTFIGPSIYFHRKTLWHRHRHSSALGVLSDRLFFDYLYATLTAWGMHRMGRTNTKLVDLSTMKRSFKSLVVKSALRKLDRLTIAGPWPSGVRSVTKLVWRVISHIEVGVGETRIVAGSKALHHLLPDLVPPIDRTYTLPFFYGHRKQMLNGGRAVFLEIFPQYRRIAIGARNQILPVIDRGEMNTSITKVIDNAIVGFMVRRRAAQ